MTLVIGTAGHIDHGKTTLLRALTGIDADRLPEERRRGMTIDVGYAHLTLDDGRAVDFVDVPGHDRLVGNMLVGAGEIDAALLVVAADDGPRAQTLEHLALLDALDIRPGLAVVTKIDGVEPARVAEVVAAVTDLLASTSLAGSPVLAASGATGEGLDDVRAALAALVVHPPLAPAARPPTLAVDRVFTVKGRGVVVTGTLRGGPLTRGDSLRLVPGHAVVRVREIQVHGTTVERVDGGGRTALNIAGAAAERLHRGMVLTTDSEVVATERMLAAFRVAVPDRTRGRVHAGTAAVDAAITRSGRDALTLPDGRVAGVVRLAEPIAMRAGDRFVLRRGVAIPPLGGIVLDTAPPRGISRRRQTAERVAALADRGDRAATNAVDGGQFAGRLELHGAIGGALAPDVAAAAAEAAIAVADPTASLGEVRATVARSLRRNVTISRDQAATAATALIDDLVRDGRLLRDGDTIRRAGVAAPGLDPALVAAMGGLESALAVFMPPSLAEAARTAGCPQSGIRALERSGRIVVLEPDLAYAVSTYRDLVAQALALAGRQPLTPATFRDATGTSRRYVMAILEDLDRRAILRRTPDGHIPGPRAPAAAPAGQK